MIDGAVLSPPGWRARAQLGNQELLGGSLAENSGVEFGYQVVAWFSSWNRTAGCKSDSDSRGIREGIIIRWYLILVRIY